MTNNFYYNHQLVINEWLEAKWENHEIISEEFKREKQYTPGTMTGTLYFNNVAELTFVVEKMVNFVFNQSVTVCSKM